MQDRISESILQQNQRLLNDAANDAVETFQLRTAIGWWQLIVIALTASTVLALFIMGVETKARLEAEEQLSVCRVEGRP